MLLGHGLHDREADFLHVDCLARGALHFMHHHQYWRLGGIVEREGGAPSALAQGRVCIFRRALDILRIIIGATNDDQILEAAGYVQLAVMKESQIAGT